MAYKNSKNGKYVSKEYAKKHPATTEHEKYKKKGR